MPEQACFAVILFPYYLYYLTAWSWSAATLLYFFLNRIYQTKSGKIQTAIEVGPYIGGRHWISRSRVYSDQDLSSPLHSSYPQKAACQGFMLIMPDQETYRGALYLTEAIICNIPPLSFSNIQCLSSWMFCNLKCLSTGTGKVGFCLRLMACLPSEGL